MSYTLCPRCGRKALSIATRCPHCGDPFEIRRSYNSPRPRLREPFFVVTILAVVATYLGIDALRRRPAAPAGSEAMSIGVDSVPPAQPRRARAVPLAARPSPASESAPAAASPDSASPDAASPDTAGLDLASPNLAIPDLASPDTATPLAGLTGGTTESSSAHQERRYITIWANVREERRPIAPVVTVLEPGQPVLVDSLRGEWYRVVEDGQKVGYVYSGLVAMNPPGARN